MHVYIVLDSHTPGQQMYATEHEAHGARTAAVDRSACITHLLP